MDRDNSPCNEALSPGNAQERKIWTGLAGCELLQPACIGEDW